MSQQHAADDRREAGLAGPLLELTAAQRGMWFAESLSSEYSVNIAQYVDIRHAPGGLDIELFARCCEEVGKLVESPFVRLTEIDGIPVVAVLRTRADDVGAMAAMADGRYAVTSAELVEVRACVDQLELGTDQFQKP